MPKSRSAPAALLSAIVLILGGPQPLRAPIGPAGRFLTSVPTISVGPFGALHAPTTGRAAVAWSLMILGAGLAGAAARRRRALWLLRLPWEATTAATPEGDAA